MPITTKQNLEETLRDSMGSQEPLLMDAGRRQPDRRRVSLRWLTGTFLTGVTSAVLIGGSLYAALDGRQKLAEPAEILRERIAGKTTNDAKAERGDRPLAIVSLEPASEQILQVPTVTKVGDRNVIRKRPFAYASAPLAVAPARKMKYRPFNALEVFSSSDEDVLTASSDAIYGADIESEVTIKTSDFPLDSREFDTRTEITTREAEAIVATTMDSLGDGSIQVAALPYVDATRFELDEETVEPTTAQAFKLTAENVSTIEMSPLEEEVEKTVSEEVIAVSKAQSLSTLLSKFDAEQSSLNVMADALSGNLGSNEFKAGTKLRIAYERPPGDGLKDVRRVSVYRGGRHLTSIARNDDGAVVYAPEPAPIPATANEEEKARKIATVSAAKLPSVYDGINRAAFSQGLTSSHARRLVRIFAFDVDFRTQISPADDMEVFYSMEEDAEGPTEDSEILYASIKLNGVKRKYYRFRASDDKSVDYYDEEGKSAKKFLLRQPVPNARFGSSFGPRRHPISRRMKMHSGVDFSAPRGTPILAAGNGVVEKAGWGGGCGKRTLIRHANGYKTQYCHQHRFAKGVKAGARVRQGQIIGQVGSTGYSTGPHLHYEVIVNGSKVNPMRIRLPKGRVLKGSQLAAFNRERDRIDALLEKGRASEPTQLALK